MIEITGLCKQFGRFDAIRGLTFSVPEGSAFALVGANGAGKTTTIKTLMNLIEPDQGSIRVMGVESVRLAASDYARIGYVSENQDLPERLTVRQFLSFLRPLYPTWDSDLEAALVSQTQLPRERKIGDLSHGMRSKLALICALIFHPRLLVFDEPFNGLDPLACDEFMAILGRHRGHTTLLISSHDLGEIEDIATHIAFIDRGSLLFQESMAELLARVREVHVITDSGTPLPRATPDGWLSVEQAGDTITFIDTQFQAAGFEDRVRAVFGPARTVDVRPIKLRSIFTAIARSITNEDTR
jgi:ABC-2 type transport system ATP-binding protein